MESRIMKVSMTEKAFADYDAGLVSSNKGLRDENGRLRHLPNISNLSDEDLPVRYVPYNSHPIRNAIADSVAEFIMYESYRLIYDPLARRKAVHRIKQLKSYISGVLNNKTKAQYLLKKQEEEISTKFEIETTKDGQRIVVSGEKAQRIIEAIRDNARNISSLIILLSTIVIKDDKTDSELSFEKAFIQMLLSEEYKKTMQDLDSYNQILDDRTKNYISCFLDGFIPYGSERIPIPK